MKKTYITTMPDKAGAFLKASQVIASNGGNIVRANKSGKQFAMRLDGNENIITGNVLVQYGPEDLGTGNLVEGNLVTTGGVSDGV